METQTQTPNPLAVKFPDLKATLDKLSWTHEAIPEGKHGIEVMGEVGDTKHIWDKRKPDEVEAARTLYAALTKKGYRAFLSNKNGDPGEQMTSFDPDAQSVVFVPQMAGG